MAAHEIRLSDIANKLGVHRATVARALNHDPRISSETGKRVRKEAQRRGYRINPLVAALMQSRRNGRRAEAAVIGYVTDYPERWGWKEEKSHLQDFFPGAERRALASGYKLEHLWLAEPGMTARRFATMLRTRNIHGFIIGRLPRGHHELSRDIDFRPFFSVALGLSMTNPALHRVRENHFNNARVTAQACLARGYRRVGIALQPAEERHRVSEMWLGGLLSEIVFSCEQDDQIPALVSPDAQRDDFLRWVERHRPDALIVTEALQVIQWLRESGYRVPADIGVAELRMSDPSRGHTGIYNDPADVGALATEMLIGLMHRNETGVPEKPHTVLLDGQWMEGRTLGRRPETA